MDVLKHKDEFGNTKLEMNRISESEKKRLQSVKQKKETFRAKEEIVQNALRNLDNKSTNNKIIFDEDIDKVEQPKLKRKDGKKQGKKRKDLFDNVGSEDENEPIWDKSDFEIKKNLGGKPIGGNAILGNDERFKIDDRFMENDDASEQNEVSESNDISDLQKEKEWQLDILGNVLGVPVAPKNKDSNKDPKPAKKGMIRYDPTENNHREYEIVAEKSEPTIKKVKTKKRRTEEPTPVVETAPVEVTKDIYFSVSESLTKSLKQEEQFSLLKTYGKEDCTEKNDTDCNKPNIESNKNLKFQFHFDTKNPFKYDSSDDEQDNEEVNNEKSIKNSDDQNEQHENNLRTKTDRLFFDANDVRFNEAIKFFSKESVPGDKFKNLRRKLKQIVRTKIRKNVRKNEPWGSKRKVKKLS